MRIIFLLLFTCLIAGRVNAQSLFRPGGESGLLFWYQTDTSSTSTGLRSLIPGNPANLLPEKDKRTGYLNFHPALVFSGDTRLSIDVDGASIANATYFTVYHCTDTSRENGIWYTSGEKSANLVLTTSRMADLGSFSYMNYTDLIRSNPKVNTYVQQKNEDSISRTINKWYIGPRPVSPQLPISSFKGLIPEIIVYDRALSGQERLQVASYLALKYGITLTEPNATYLNSAGEKIWDGSQYSSYHHNVAGIGRDDSSGLLQNRASSSNIPGLLTVWCNQLFEDRSFLLWGDNGLPMALDKKAGGMPRLLQKKWNMIAYGGAGYTTDLQLDTRQVDIALSKNPVYWLAIDRSGKGIFSLESTDFVRMTDLDPDGKALFKDVSWRLTGAGKEVFGILAAQNLLLATKIDSPDCAGTKTAAMEIKILGGSPPYHLMVTGPGSLFVERSVTAAGGLVERIQDLPAGKYWLRVVDASQATYADSFYINKAGAPQTAELMDSYNLLPGGKLSLDASAGQPGGLSYQWTGPDNFQSSTPVISISKAGTYTLQCGSPGCSTFQDVQVRSIPGIFSDRTVYPNPTPGAFKVRVNLSEAAPVTMTVYTLDGRPVMIQKGEDRSNYLFEGSLQTAGEYQIVLVSGLSRTTQKLIITK